MAPEITRWPRLLLRGINRAVCRIAIWLIIGYQRTLGHLIGGQCRFYPTCSEYAKIAFGRFNFFYALWLTIMRLLRCQPLCRGGEDLPPAYVAADSVRSVPSETPVPSPPPAHHPGSTHHPPH